VPEAHVRFVSTGEALLRLMDLNLAESNREQARFLSPSRIVEHHDVLYTASGTRWPAGPFNSLIGTGAACPDPSKALAEARAFYGEVGRRFTVFTRTHLDGELAAECGRAGFVQVSDPPGMALASPLRAFEPAASVRIREVKAVADVEGFVGVLGAAYTSIGLPAEVTQKIFSMPERWSAPHLMAFVLLDHDEPASAAMLLFSHGIGGVYWVATAPNMRGKGHASTIMRHVSNLAFERGAAAVVLQATPFGEPVYRKLGYREVTRYPWFLAGK
jgi:GNAT superfamily N-acetyltransferase